MNEEEKKQAACAYTGLLQEVTDRALREGVDLLVIDEFMSAYNHSLLDREAALEFLKNRPAKLEVVLTGRDPASELLELADYVSEIRKVKHPFDQGIPARKGIEL